MLVLQIQIRTQNTIVFLKPCTADKYEIASILWARVKQGNRELAQRLIDLFPRCDQNGYGLEVGNLSPAEYGEIFLLEEGAIGQLLKLPERPPPQYSLHNPPVKSCNNLFIDLHAQLSAAIGVEQAELLLHNYSLQEIIAWQEVYGDVARPLEERAKDYADRLWKEQVAVNDIEFYHKYIQNLEFGIGEKKSLTDLDLF